MDDPFELLGLDRRPFLEAARIKDAYRERARLWHPDAPDGDAVRFQALGDALAVVGDPVRRLRALAGGAGSGAAAASDVSLFLRVGEALAAGRELAGQLERARNALGRALLGQEVAAASRRVKVTSGEVEERLAEVGREVVSLDARWPGVSPEELLAVAVQLERLTKWSRELQQAALDLRS